MRKIREITIWLGLLAYLVLAFGFVSVQQNRKGCASIHIIMTDESPSLFVEQSQIRNLIKSKYPEIDIRPISKLNLAAIEDMIDSIPAVRKAEVYSTINGRLIIEITQRTPIVRIINTQGRNFYIDDEGVLIPVSHLYTARVPVANGNILFTGDFSRKMTVNNDSVQKLLPELRNLAQYIASNDFWSAQIEQIYVANNGDIELIPRVGDHVIILGSVTDCEKKLAKLKAMYLQGFTRTGWNTYKTINLKFENQVVCTRK